MRDAIVISTREGVTTIRVDTMLRHLAEWMRDNERTDLETTIEDGTRVSVRRTQQKRTSCPDR